MMYLVSSLALVGALQAPASFAGTRALSVSSVAGADIQMFSGASKSAPKKKAGLMGSLLMKAHKEGNLEDAVDAMEAAGVE